MATWRRHLCSSDIFSKLARSRRDPYFPHIGKILGTVLKMQRGEMDEKLKS